jgi:hypothetical protein
MVRGPRLPLPRGRPLPRPAPVLLALRLPPAREEAIGLEARHVRLDAECGVIRPAEAKGRRRHWVILLYGPALEIVRRRGKKWALVAAAHTQLVIAYHLLESCMTYRELGADYFDRFDTDRATRKLVKRQEQLGHTVTLMSAVA